jgi:hypothetical protein
MEHLYQMAQGLALVTIITLISTMIFFAVYMALDWCSRMLAAMETIARIRIAEHESREATK